MTESAYMEDLTGPLLDTLGAVVVILDAEGHIVRTNKACTELIGYALEEAQDRKVWDLLVPAEEAAAVKNVFAELLAGKTPNHHTNHWITKSGDRRLIAWSNSAVLAADGRVRAVIGTGIDVTDQRAAETALGERQATLSAILETAVDAIITVNQEGRIMTANPAAETLFGFSLAEMLGENVKMLMPEPYRSEHDGYMHHYMETGERKIIGIGREVTGRRKDGSVFPMQLAVSEFTFDGERRFTGIVHDISKRKETERLNTRLGRIVEDSVNEVYVFDAESLRFLQANRGAVENLGYTRDELLRLTPMDIKPDISRARFEQLLAPLRTETREQVEFETFHRRKNGTRYDVLVRLQLMHAENPPVYIAIIEDITERKEQQGQLRQAQKMEAIGQLTGGVAHDFNNLLTVIVGNLEMLEGMAEEEVQKEIIAEVLEATDMGADLTSRLLAFARRQPLEPQTLDLNNLVLKTSDLLRRTLGESIRIKTILGHGLWPVHADPVQLENVLLNLAINARDAMPEGGDLIVETGNATLDEATLGPFPEATPGRSVYLAVTDQGEGMSPEIQSRAFEPFFTTKQAGSGTGLGLSMVYGFAKQSGGHATIESQVGKGTTVRVFLPAADKRETAAPMGSAHGKGHGGSESILLVEDDSRVRRLTARRLANLGYKVTEAADAAEALGFLRQGNRFDLLLTDVIMPGEMSGSDLAIEARYLRSDIKILLTSGYADPDSLEATRAIAEAGFLRKPYKEGELAQTIRRLLDT